MKKTLLCKSIGILMSMAVVVSVGGCSSIFTSEGQVEEVDQEIEQQRQELQESIKKNNLSYQIDAIGSAYYLGDNKLLIREFDKFLEKKGISKEKILDYLKRQEIYNNSNEEKNKLMDYFSKKEKVIFEESSEEIYALYCLL